MNRLIITIVSLIYSQLATAQTVLRLVDANSHFPIESAFILTTNTSPLQLYVSDLAGEISIDKPTPLIIQVRHLNYLTRTDTITASGTTILALTPTNLQLQEVVVTGQHQPHAAENSVYRVHTITKDRITNQGAITMDDVFKTELNVRLSQDLAIGNSALSLQGMSGQNVKILVDGIPLVNRNGNGNDADLSQINLQEVEKIEIVEGPMAVNYGANALAGVINIITAKSSQHKGEINLTSQEESAGKEYGILRGKHVQRVDMKYNFSPSWYGQLSGSKNNFLGYKGTMEGRQKEWNPKDQWTSGALMRHTFAKHTIFYKVDYLNELIISKGQQRESIEQGQRIPFAFDEEYKTNRLSHQVQADGKVGLSSYNLVVSYSDFERIKRRYSKNLHTGSEILTTAEGDQDTSTFSAWVLRGTLSNSLHPRLSLQTGYDFNLESAAGGRIADGLRSINDVGFFSSVEWVPIEKLKLRPGLRYAINSVYKTPLLPSLNLKYDLNDHTSLRAAYGKGYRAPSLRELYFEFVDSNHKIYGNDKLMPEYSHHYDLYLTRKITRAAHRTELTAGAFYNDMTNQITFLQSPDDATVVTYFNVLKYKTAGFTAEQKSDWNRFSNKTGIAYTGRYNQLSEEDSLSLRKFFFSPEVTANLSYKFPQISMWLNLFYKYTGKLRTYIAGDGNAVGIDKLDDYHWLDLTAGKKMGRNFNLTAGVKNLLDVQRLNTSGQSGGTHSGGSSQPVSYGRSFFLSINYSLTIKQHDEH